MDNNKIEKIIENCETSGNPNEYSALTLAYLGDCVYELYVRSHIVRNGNAKVNDLHKLATSYVKAKAQAEFYHKIKDILTEEEDSAFRRGRNTKSQPPKNADMMDYRIATGIETLIGHLYVKGDAERISELITYLF